MKKYLSILFLIFLCLGCGENAIKMEAYFKDDNKNRIKTYSFDESIMEDDIIKHGKKQMNTAGRLTAVYYYPKGAKIPRSGVQNAQDIFYANTVIDMYAEEIDCIYMIGQDGKHYFANCIENPDDDWCVNNSGL